MSPTPPLEVLRHYAADTWRGVEIHSLGSAGGFSGAHFWRWTSPLGERCLRRWPQEHPTPQRLAWIHSVLQHVARDADVPPLPLPLRTLDGATFVEHEGRLWELTPWLPGAAERTSPPPQRRVEEALRGLAHWHRAAASASVAPPDHGPSAVLEERWCRLHDVARQVEQIAAALAVAGTTLPSWLADSARRIGFLAPRAAASLLRRQGDLPRLEGTRQAVIRDIWRDNVLFVDERVSGIVDFGASRIDHPWVDVARLAGSYVADDDEGWAAAFAAYHAIRELSDDERRAARLLDRAGVVTGGVQWLAWLLVERRVFEDWDAVRARIRWFCERLVANS